MNIEKAKCISMTEFLAKLGYNPMKENHKEAWYFSPLRVEKTASFKVNISSNKWYDFGQTRGGDIIDFTTSYLKSRGEDSTIHDALRFCHNIIGENFEPIVLEDRPSIHNQHVLSVINVAPIKHIALKRYIEQRGIVVDLAKKCLKEVKLCNSSTKSRFFALGLKNEEDGYDLRNPMFKGTVGKKSISFIRGSNSDIKAFHVFEGMFDYLSALTLQSKKQFEEDVIVLNSLGCMHHLVPYIKFHNYKNAYSWLDNDDAGQNATQKLQEFCESVPELNFVSKNHEYSNFNDVNELLIAQSKLEV